MSTQAELKGKRDELTALRSKMKDVFAEATEGGRNRDLDMSKVTSITGTDADKVNQIRKWDEEATALGAEIDAHVEKHGDLDALAALRDRLESANDDAGVQVYRPAIVGNPDAAKQQDAHKSIGRQFVESVAYTGRVKKGIGPEAELPVPSEIVATTMTTSAGWAPESIRNGVVVPDALTPIQVSQLVTMTPTTQAAVVYMEETTATNAAAERAENAAYAESAIAFTERTAAVKSIGTSLPITDEQLDDVPQAEAFVNGRLMFFVQQRLDSQLLNGDGTGATITGYFNATGLQTQDATGLSTPDAVFKAMTKVRHTGMAFPNAVILNPTDWENVRLLKTADGVYIYGNPADSGPERMWGATAVQASAATVTNALVGDFSPAWSHLAVRAGIETQVGYVNDDFLDGRQTIRAGMRATLVVYRGAAFCEVTNIGS